MRQPSFTKDKRYISRGAVLSERMVRRICSAWRDRQGKCSERAIGERFGVSRSCVNHIVSGRSWQHITLPLLFDMEVSSALEPKQGVGT